MCAVELEVEPEKCRSQNEKGQNMSNPEWMNHCLLNVHPQPVLYQAFSRACPKEWRLAILQLHAGTERQS